MVKDEAHNSPFCYYPPRLSADVDVTEQRDAEGVRYVVRNRATARYFLLKPTEYQIFRQLDGKVSLSELAAGGSDGSGPRVSLAGLGRFLSRLDALGLLAYGGEQRRSATAKSSADLYPRIRIYNPDRLLGWLDRRFGWVFTRGFVVASLALFILVILGLLVRAAEVATYTAYTYGVYGLAGILLFTLTITAAHEFAHGLACKHFGGEVREMGVLMIYYVLPAFYCNVTDIYRIGNRRERLWVIAAGIYWQLLVSAAAALVWLLATPYSALADFTFLVFLGATFNIIINCNPLIKLDGYYALSQLTGAPNLQAQASQYVGALVGRVLGDRDEKITASPQAGATRPARPPHRSHSPRRKLLLGYWIGSLLYSLALIWFILGAVGGWLMRVWGFAGVLLTLLLTALLTRRWWKPVWNSFGVKPMSVETPPANAASSAAEKTAAASPKTFTVRRSLVIKSAVAVLVLAILALPWEASTSSDCTLLLPPGREEVARANTSAVLAEVFVQPGDAVAEGARLARLANPELEDRLTQLNAEIQRLDTNSARLEDELRVRSESLLAANLKETDRKRLLDEMKSESSQIHSGYDRQSLSATAPLPAALAILQSEVELKQTELAHNRREVERYEKLLAQGLVGAQVYDRAVAAVRISEKEVQTAKAKLAAAIVEHSRSTRNLETGSLVAETEARAARSGFEMVIAELHANRQQLAALRARQEILRREYDRMNISAPRAGIILGEDLRKAVGKHFATGEELCRIGELQSFQLDIQVSEREISYVRLDSPVRFKLKTVPGRVFTGRVSKINAEPVTDANGQQFYPVEVAVENADGLLRPGMTGFARISFGKQAIGVICAQKIWHSLRPELWLF